MSFTILTGPLEQFISDKALADATLLNPLVALPLVQGEWLVNTATGYARIAAAATDQEATLVHGRPLPVFSERGDTSIQAIGKVPLVEHGGSYRVRTNVYKSVNGTSGLAIDTASVLNAELTVAAVVAADADPHAGRTVLKEAASADLVVGRLVKLPTVAGGEIEVDILPTPYIKP